MFKFTTSQQTVNNFLLSVYKSMNIFMMKQYKNI